MNIMKNLYFIEGNTPTPEEFKDAEKLIANGPILEFVSLQEIDLNGPLLPFVGVYGSVPEVYKRAATIVDEPTNNNVAEYIPTPKAEPKPKAGK